MVTLLGAGPVRDGDLDAALAIAPVLVAADGGADHALAKGHLPEAVIGDFDSVSAATQAAIPPERLHPDPDQDSTDIEKALTAISAPLILALGFTGGRLDHELAAYNALVRKDGAPAVIIGEEDICFHLTRPIALTLAPGTRVSLFPMAETRCASTGLRWPTDHLLFQPWGRVGTSNESLADTVTLTPGGPGMLVILPKALLPEAIGALTPPASAIGDVDRQPAE
jgi:thiamine pyrophosphokinase